MAVFIYYFNNFDDVKKFFKLKHKFYRTRSLASKFLRPESNRLQNMGLMQDRKCHDVDKHGAASIAVWADMKQSMINKAIDERRSRLTACVPAKG